MYGLSSADRASLKFQTEGIKRHPFADVVRFHNSCYDVTLYYAGNLAQDMMRDEVDRRKASVSVQPLDKNLYFSVAQDSFLLDDGELSIIPLEPNYLDTLYQRMSYACASADALRSALSEYLPYLKQKGDNHA